MREVAMVRITWFTTADAQLWHARLPLCIIRIRCTLAMLLPISRALCHKNFCGVRVKACITTAASSSSADVRDLPECCLHMSCTVPSASNLSRILEIVSRVGDSVANSLLHLFCTSNIISDCQYHFKINLCCSKAKRACAILRCTLPHG